MVWEQGKRTLYYRAPHPPTHTMVLGTGKGKKKFCSSFGINPTMEQVFPVGAS